MYGQCSANVNQVGLPNRPTQSTYQNVASTIPDSHLYANQCSASTCTPPTPPPPPPPPFPLSSLSTSQSTQANGFVTGNYNSQDLPLPPPPPPCVLSSVEPEIGIPLIKPTPQTLPKQSPAFNRLQPYIGNSVPRPFVPNQSSNTWRPVNLNTITTGAHKPPEPLNHFRSTDIDEPTPPVVACMNPTSIRHESRSSSNYLTANHHSINPQRSVSPSKRAGPVTNAIKEEGAGQLRDQLSRLLIDRQKQIQGHQPSTTAQTSANRFHSLDSTASIAQLLPSKSSLQVPSPAPSKSLSGLNSASISPLGSVSSLGSAGSLGSISPKSSASGVRVLPSAADSSRRRPSPLYQNSNEAEVDYLTDLLVKGLNGKSKPDAKSLSKPITSATKTESSSDVCIKCNESIKTDGNGLSAMGKMFHIKCFTCNVCNISLRGSPFYALDEKAYCEKDYLNTLEKCSVCQKPIMDRLLRANGKPYHPECFCCVECGKCLDGIVFTVDCSNQIYCIDDFHKKFAPRCCVCNEPIMPENGQRETVRIVALDRSFHVKCYRCEDCGLQLSSDSDKKDLRCYPMDGHILCKNCNNQRIQDLITSEMIGKRN